VLTARDGESRQGGGALRGSFKKCSTEEGKSSQDRSRDRALALKEKRGVKDNSRIWGDAVVKKGDTAAI